MKTVLLVDALGKRTLSLSTPVYESIKQFILSVVKEKSEVLFTELLDQAERDKTILFEGDMGWCFMVVKRDLEARGIIKVKVGLGPRRAQVLSLNKSRRTIRSFMYF
jgi:hypothetical protein